jgi:outer membrane autotransporter protein
MDQAMHNSVAETMGRGGYWTHAFGSMTRQNNSGDDVGFKAQTGGLLVGGDVKLSSNAFFGVSGGFTKTLMKMNENGGNHHLDSYMMSLYGTWFEGPFALDYSLTGSLNVYNLVRRVVIPGNPDSDVASMHHGYEISPFVGLSYEFNVDDLRITPYLNGSLSATKERGYRENGGLVDQQVQSRNSYFASTEIGLTLAQDFALEDKVFTPSLKLGYGYKKPLKTGAIVASFAGATGSYSVTPTNKAINEFIPSLEGTMRWKDGLYVGASYSAELSKDYKVHELTLKLGKRF